MYNRRDYSLKFSAWSKASSSQKMKDIMKEAREYFGDKPKDFFENIREALVVSGLFKPDALISIKILSDEEYKYIEESLPRLDLSSVATEYHAKEFEHAPVDLIGIYLDTETCDMDLNSNEFRELDNELSLGLQNDLNSGSSVSNILNIIVKETDIVSMYDKYFNEHSVSEMFYEIVVEIIRTFIPMTAVYMILNSLEDDAPSYNKYALTILVAYVARIIGVKFNLELCTEDEDLSLQIAGYELAFFKNLDLLARTAVKSEKHWMEDCGFEANAGALAGCGVTIGRVPGIKTNIDTKDSEFEQVECRLGIYYESVNELMFMVAKMVSTYVLNLNAKRLDNIYIGEEIPTNALDELTLKLKEVKANHKRVLRYSDVLINMDKDAGEPKSMTRLFEKEKLNGIFQTAIGKLESFDMPFNKDDFASMDEYTSAVQKEIMGAYKDIKYAVKRGKFRDKCRIRELTDPDNLKEVEEVINDMSKKFDTMHESVDEYDTDEWKVACKLLLSGLD